MVGFTTCIDISTLPTDMEGFYATNNQFQKRGPKGFIQVKVLDDDKLYVRVDLPGVPDDAVHHRVDAVRQKVVFFSAVAFNDGYEKQGVREYSGTAGLGCDCCEITGVDAKMKDGVLRMILSRVKVKDHDTKCTHTVPPFTGKSGRRVEEHPFVVKGRKRAFVGEPTADGGLFFAVDVPGVGDGDVEVLANESEIKFTAEVKNVFEHDESAGRLYLGSIDTSWSGDSAASLLSHYNITGAVNFGVLKVLITPRPNTGGTKE
ncbi:uncharacterized protein LOC103827634 [Brassica rapa]|uniref:SHSP domain-containing protein n=1 Tax=Brassica campestris TaxID=3711 RepID=M4E824_BRACM|nr:uncharacterized protein LOC103827634 [Brassica rapa]XP_013695906.2 uncharacterized protein LOC106400036 [Brassica napus]